MAASAAPAQPLRMGGTGSVLGLLQQVSAEFTTATETKIDIVPALGSSGAMRALADGKLDLVVSARSLNADQVAAGLTQVAVLQTAYVFATSHRNPNGLKSQDLAGIFASEKPTWDDGTPMRIILRPRSEADTTLLGKLFAGMDAAIETARRRSEVPTAATDQDNVALAERVSGSLIGTSAAQLATEHPNLRVVPLDNVVPNFANYQSGVYPYTKLLYVLIRANGNQETHRFVDFLRSPAGVKTLRAAETVLGVK
ncbi:MAG: substrate-binding domain-containing protein [Rhizobiales bacterium]|nr:substrate-binding domain-containing protein [Hyphomicrobiales bacterium]